MHQPLSYVNTAANIARNVVIEPFTSIDNNVEKKLARIKEIIEQQPDEIQILFNSETANLKEEHKNKIINFINSQHNKKKLNFKITSYAKTDKSEDISTFN